MTPLPSKYEVNLMPSLFPYDSCARKVWRFPVSYFLSLMILVASCCCLFQVRMMWNSCLVSIIKWFQYEIIMQCTSCITKLFLCQISVNVCYYLMCITKWLLCYISMLYQLCITKWFLCQITDTYLVLSLYP